MGINSILHIRIDFEQQSTGSNPALISVRLQDVMACGCLQPANRYFLSTSEADAVGVAISALDASVPADAVVIMFFYTIHTHCVFLSCLFDGDLHIVTRHKRFYL